MLVTKKHYVGHMFETPSQTVPTFDAKESRLCAELVSGGGEDLANLAEASVCLQGPEPGQRACSLSSARFSRVECRFESLSLQRRFGLGLSSANGGQLPPAALVAVRLSRRIRGASPNTAAREVRRDAGQPGAKLIDMVFSPGELISRGSLRLHAEYYCKNR